jgi:hypothetical protein
VVVVVGQAAPGVVDHRREAGATAGLSRPARALLLVLGLLLGAGCADDDPPGNGPPEPTARPPAERSAPGEVVLRVRSAGGLAPSLTVRPPAVTLYGDGRLVTLRPASGSAPAMPQLEVRTLSAGATTRILALLRERGLAGAPTVTDPPTPDGVATIVSVRWDGKVVRNEFYGLSPRPGEPADRARLRAAARSLLADLADVESLVGRANVSAPAPLTPARLALSARRVAAGEPATDVRPWPPDAGELSALPLPPRCRVVTGRAAEVLTATLASAPAATVWERAGQRWRVVARPLLPDETGCP